MNENRLADYLDHMREAARDTCSFVEGLSKDAFLADKRTQQAVIMSPIVVGEAASRVMDGYAEFANQHRHVPWRSMRGGVTALRLGISTSTSMRCGIRYKSPCRICWNS